MTKAKFLSEVGKKTPMFARFSTVGGEKGSPDTVRDPRGFALKFYTEESSILNNNELIELLCAKNGYVIIGNVDIVSNNTPVC